MAVPKKEEPVAQAPVQAQAEQSEEDEAMDEDKNQQKEEEIKPKQNAYALPNDDDEGME